MLIDITVLDNRLKSFINISSSLQILDSDCSFSEGPVWHPDGFLLFSDIPKNAIYKIKDGRKELYLDKSGCINKYPFLSEQIGSNGLAFNEKGQLIICQHGEGAVVKYAAEGLQPLATTFEGKRFNSPNDLVVHEDSIFFSDPPYGLAYQKINPLVAQPKSRIYCLRNNEVHIVSEDYQYPNGVCLSADGKRLYTCSNKTFERFVLEFDIHTLTQSQIVAQENGDGIKCDAHGNIYLCAKEGIVIINNEGERLGVVKLQTVPANCCWGGAEGNDLFITARENIYVVNNFLQ